MTDLPIDVLLELAPVGLALLDDQLRFVVANEELNRISGRRSEDVLGRTLDEIINRPELTAIATSVLETGRSVSGVDVSGVTADGRRFDAVADYHKVGEGVGVVVRDITAVVAAEARVARLQDITAALAAARTTEEIVSVVLDDIREGMGAAAATVLLLRHGRVSVAGFTGHSDQVRSWWSRARRDRRSPFIDVVRRGETVLANGDDLAERWPDVADFLPPRAAIAVLPLRDGGQPAGAFVLNFDGPRPFDDDDRAFLEAVATQCGDALRRARLHEAEGAAATRMAYLAEASDTLASSLDWKETLRRVADLAVPRLADFAAAVVVDGDEITAMELASVDTNRADTIRSLIRGAPDTLGIDAALRALVHADRPVLIADLGAGTSDRERMLSAAGFQSLVAVTMRVRSRVVGMIILATAAPRRLTDDDLTLAGELATRAGQAIVNAELFRERSHVAATLQASLLPPATPTVPGYEVATRFYAVGEGIDVGGDFYDVFRMGTVDDPADEWAVVIGDVRGKGTEAATVSGAARHAVRTAALHERSPAAVLRRLNELLLVMGVDDEFEEPRFCTAVVASVAPDGNVTMASGGHPPPMVLRHDGTTERVELRGSLLGVLGEPAVEEGTIRLRPGESLVLYTDGVTERHTGAEFFDEESLAGVLARCAGFTAAATAERVETASRAFLADAPRDDVAVVVVRVPTQVATSSVVGADLPADDTAPGVARRFVEASLDALGLAGAGETAALLASELATNALLHAHAPYRITVEAIPGAVRIGVTDATTTAPLPRPADDRATSGRGMRLIDALASAWGVEVADTGKTVWFELPR